MFNDVYERLDTASPQNEHRAFKPCLDLFKLNSQIQHLKKIDAPSIINVQSFRQPTRNIPKTEPKQHSKNQKKLTLTAADYSVAEKLY